MALNPVGPEPPGVYWRRRAVLLIVLLVVLLLVLKACGGGDGTASTANRPSPSGSSPSGSDTAGSSTSQPTARPSATPSTPAPAASPGAAARACTDADVAVRVTTDARTYAAGVQPRFTLTVRNTSATPCRRDVGPAALELVVTSGSASIWSSDTCKPKGASQVTDLAPKRPSSTVVAWSRIRLTAACPTSKPAALPGTYRVVGRAGLVRSDPTVFVLR